MRPYRGKTKDGKWVYGWYVKVFGHHYIYDESDKENWEGKWGGEGTTHDLLTMLLGFVEVIPETVGQFVCPDKNGKDVFAGDPVHYQGKDYPRGFLWDESGLRWDLGNGFFHTHYGATGTGGEDDYFDIELIEEKE